MIFQNRNYYSGYYERSINENVNVESLIKSTTVFNTCYIIPPYGDDVLSSCPYIDESGTIFLDGSCNLFAKQLHEVFNYHVFEVSNNKGCHWYCTTEYNHKKMYIDVRGATSDFDVFSSRYSFIKSQINPKPHFHDELSFRDEPWRETGILFAISIIDANRTFYGDFSIIN